MSRRLPIAFIVLAQYFALPVKGQTPASDPLRVFPVDRVVQQVDGGVTVTLSNSVSPKARPEIEAGAVPGDRVLSRMILVLKRDAAQEAAVEALFTAQQDPRSPQYHRWLTNESYAQHFGVSPHDLDQVARWLRGNGLTVDEISPAGWSITFTGTVAQASAAFHTRIDSYKDPKTGETHYANATQLEVPQALGGVIASVVGLDDFRARPLSVAHRVPRSEFTAGSSHFLAPADYAAIYDLSPLYRSGIDGTGQTIAIVGDCEIDPTVVQAFRAYFGLAANNTIINTISPGEAACDTSEPYLDVEWSGVVAKNATVELVVNGGAGDIYGSASYIVDNDTAPVVSTSFSDCEANGSSANWSLLWSVAALKGITPLVSSGDSGAAGCDDPDTEAQAVDGLGVNAICSSAYSICVGGTEFNDAANPSLYWSPSGNAYGYIPENAWNESGLDGGSGLWASGGGYSVVWNRPSWQTGNSNPMRGVPDVSMTAAGHDGYLVCYDLPCSFSGEFWFASGTSAASPSFAAIMSLVVQKTGERWGNPGSVLYGLAAQTDLGTVFHDVVSGNNSVPGQPGYATAPGWDPVTGLGSVDASGLVNAWAGAFAPAVQLSAQSLGFGNEPVGFASPSQTVTLTNQGSGVLTISNIALAGANTGDFPTNTTCPPIFTQSPVTVGSSCVFTVTFKPTATGQRTAAISIADNAPGSPHTLSLSGTGTSVATPPSITVIAPASITAGSSGFILSVTGAGFASTDSVLWNGAAIPTGYISSTQLSASVGASLIASAGVATVAVTGSGLKSTALIFTVAPISSLSPANQRVTTQAPPSSGCATPPAVSSFLTSENVAYLYFTATVTASDSLTNNWLEPNGSVVAGVNWVQSSGNYCFTGAFLNISGISAPLLGDWIARVYDNGQLIFSVPFTVSQPANTPEINPGGVVPVYSTATTIEPGEWVSIYGSNFAGSTATWSGNFPTSLGGTSVTINGKSAYLSYVSPTLINLQAPNDTAAGSVLVAVETANGTAISTVTLAEFGPSFSLLDGKHVAGIILRSNGSGEYGGGTYDIIGPTGNSLGYGTVAAKAGDSVVLFGVGLGPTNPEVPIGQAFSGAAPTTNPVTLLINGIGVAPSWAGLSSAGLYQINLTVPAGLGTGDASLAVAVGGAETPAGVVISLQ